MHPEARLLGEAFEMLFVYKTSRVQMGNQGQESEGVPSTPARGTRRKRRHGPSGDQARAGAQKGLGGDTSDSASSASSGPAQDHSTLVSYLSQEQPGRTLPGGHQALQLHGAERDEEPQKATGRRSHL